MQCVRLQGVAWHAIGPFGCAAAMGDLVQIGSRPANSDSAARSLIRYRAGDTLCKTSASASWPRVRQIVSTVVLVTSAQSRRDMGIETTRLPSGMGSPGMISAAMTTNAIMRSRLLSAPRRQTSSSWRACCWAAARRISRRKAGSRSIMLRRILGSKAQISMSVAADMVQLPVPSSNVPTTSEGTARSTMQRRPSSRIRSVLR